MGDLIHLLNPESGNKPTKAELDARASQTEAARSERIRQLRDVLNSQPGTMLRPDDRIMVAKALYKLLKRVEETYQVKKGMF